VWSSSYSTVEVLPGATSAWYGRVSPSNSVSLWMASSVVWVSSPSSSEMSAR
jgi:hypothetical protein